MTRERIDKIENKLNRLIAEREYFLAHSIPGYKVVASSIGAKIDGITETLQILGYKCVPECKSSEFAYSDGIKVTYKKVRVK